MGPLKFSAVLGAKSRSLLSPTALRGAQERDLWDSREALFPTCKPGRARTAAAPTSISWRFELTSSSPRGVSQMSLQCLWSGVFLYLLQFRAFSDRDSWSPST